MALGKEIDKSLATAFQDLRELKVDVAGNDSNLLIV
ncbi:hypothetical protein, partial [Escherichia coli]